MIKLNFSRTLEIKQDFQKSKEHLFQKNGWLSVRIMNFVAFWLAFPLPYSKVAFKIESHIRAALKTGGIAAARGGKVGVEFPQIPISREMSLFDLSGSSL